MNLKQINKAISDCNPYTNKELRRYLVGLRRKLERQNKDDVASGNIPAMLKVQA